VEEGRPESHANKGWETFTDAIIKLLASKKKKIVYLLWGAKAHQKVLHVNSEENLILNSVHPSPLSAYRGFFGSCPFSKTNLYLQNHDKTPVKW
jgi:uracil-DNA glycosylase